MPEYEYAGPHPVPDEDNEIVRPGDVREYDAEPAWGPWRLIGEPDAVPPPPPAGEPPARKKAAPADLPADPEGM